MFMRFCNAFRYVCIHCALSLCCFTFDDTFHAFFSVFLRFRRLLLCCAVLCVDFVGCFFLHSRVLMSFFALLPFFAPNEFSCMGVIPIWFFIRIFGILLLLLFTAYFPERLGCPWIWAFCLWMFWLTSTFNTFDVTVSSTFMNSQWHCVETSLEVSCSN